MNKSLKLQLAGKISETSLSTKIKFQEIEQRLLSLGYKNIINPFKYMNNDSQFSKVLMVCLNHIPYIDYLLLIDDSTDRGMPNIEVALAKTLGKKIMNIDDFINEVECCQ